MGERRVQRSDDADETDDISRTVNSQFGYQHKVQKDTTKMIKKLKRLLILYFPPPSQRAYDGGGGFQNPSNDLRPFKRVGPRYLRRAAFGAKKGSLGTLGGAFLGPFL